MLITLSLVIAVMIPFLLLAWSENRNLRWRYYKGTCGRYDVSFWWRSDRRKYKPVLTRSENTAAFPQVSPPPWDGDIATISVLAEPYKPEPGPIAVLSGEPVFTVDPSWTFSVYIWEGDKEGN